MPSFAGVPTQTPAFPRHCPSHRPSRPARPLPARTLSLPFPQPFRSPPPRNPTKGFLLGTRQTLLETNDGGKTWAPRSIDAARDEGFNYRFNSISFAGKEGWIVGKPAILLHTSDGGANWERIPLSSKLPGKGVVLDSLAVGLIAGHASGAAPEPQQRQSDARNEDEHRRLTSRAAIRWSCAGAPVRITGLAGKPGQAEMITDQVRQRLRHPEARRVPGTSGLDQLKLGMG